MALRRAHGAAFSLPGPSRFGLLEGIGETAWPHDRLGAHRDDYEFLATVHGNIRPPSAELDLLWHRLGAKTVAMVHSRIGPVTVTGSAQEAVVADAGTIQTLWDDPELSSIKREIEDKSAQQVLDSITKRVQTRRCLTSTWQEWSTCLVPGYGRSSQPAVR